MLPVVVQPLSIYNFYQNQSIGRELTAPDTNCKVNLSLKKSDMIKRDRF